LEIKNCLGKINKNKYELKKSEISSADMGVFKVKGEDENCPPCKIYEGDSFCIYLLKIIILSTYHTQRIFLL
jgi:hypothetical protein